MALLGSDNLGVDRGGTIYRILGSDIVALVRESLGTTDYRVADITARNALDGSLTAGDTVMVDDASADSSVTSGWALYQWLAAGTWRKIAEEESLDITVGGATNLNYSPGPANGVVTSDTGTDAIIPLATAANAGLLSPSGLSKLGNITVVNPVDLDGLQAASHAAVTTAGSANNNPIVVNGSQELSFSIANLTLAP